jgi:hypothetical protein
MRNLALCDEVVDLHPCYPSQADELRRSKSHTHFTFPSANAIMTPHPWPLRRSLRFPGHHRSACEHALRCEQWTSCSAAYTRALRCVRSPQTKLGQLFKFPPFLAHLSNISTAATCLTPHPPQSIASTWPLQVSSAQSTPPRKAKRGTSRVLRDGYTCGGRTRAHP